MTPSKSHVERRYAQAERAFRALQPDPFAPGGMDRLRSPEYAALARRKAEQMTRITRRAARMVARGQLNPENGGRHEQAH